MVAGNADTAKEVLFKEHSGDITSGWPSTFGGCPCCSVVGVARWRVRRWALRHAKCGGRVAPLLQLVFLPVAETIQCMQQPHTDPSPSLFRRAHTVSLLGRTASANVSGAEHKRLRALMQPAFSAEAVARAIPMIQGIAQRHLADWAHESTAKGVVKGQKAVALHAFEVILQVGRVGGFRSRCRRERGKLCLGYV